MKKFLIEVLHEEPLLEDNLLDVVGGAARGCESAQLCNINCPKLVCGENTCPINGCPGKSLQG